MLVHLDKIVIPFYLYSWFESIAHSSYKFTPPILSILSTRVVFPWSTWATIAIFRIFFMNSYEDSTALTALQKLATIRFLFQIFDAL